MRSFVRLLELPVLDWLASATLTAATAWALVRAGAVPDGSNVAGAMFAGATVFGTMAGFLSAALLFTAGIDNPTMKTVRRKHGSELNDTLLGATFVLLLAALGSAVCGVYADGWGSRVFVLFLTILAIAKLTRAGIVTRGVLATVVQAAHTLEPSQKQTPVP
ncbi:hypothetical protein HCA61_03745 [Rhodococcus sp. HNM0563]|uniref:hypothetical protein n=1 Tax=Rhodococcus sp. HNM0563 TaxID=2716339 RepID=UPI00146E89A0|nr:hypothetical protein [Rhodococcus sp. HNM0563]NLU61373.1 hypothetical protein [Rhodococcus sp. HNM0563]